MSANAKWLMIAGAIVVAGGLLLFLAHRGKVAPVDTTSSKHAPADGLAQAQRSEIPSPIAYTVLERKVIDVSVKTQVSMRVIVQGETNKDNLDAFIRGLFNAVRSEGPYEYRDKPNLVYLYAYLSSEYAASGSQWVVMLRFGPDMNGPEVTFNERQLASLRTKPEAKFGLSEEQRREFYKEIIAAETRAQEEADKAIPTNPGETIRVGQVIVLKGKVPLCPSVVDGASSAIAESQAFLANVKELPTGIRVKVLRRIADRQGDLWFLVEASSGTGSLQTDWGTGYLRDIVLGDHVEFDVEKQNRRNMELKERLEEEHEAGVMRRYGLNKQQMDDICSEAHMKDWPMK